MNSRGQEFDSPRLDTDEWRDEPVRHRYVHGHFEGTDTRFSMYFPPEESYDGRFFQPVLPRSGTATAAESDDLYGIAGSIDFAVDSGAYLVESNLGRPNPFPGEDWSLAGYRATAAVARYSREVAAEMYGEHRPYGYLYGGSGGGFKTMSGFENAPEVWDGAVPFAIGTPLSMPNVFTVQAHAMRLLWDDFSDIVDALEPGGSGNMYAGLSTEKREALAEVTRMGFPPRAWFDYERIAYGYTAVFSVIADNLQEWDPEYFEDFWEVPGYLGAEAPESLLEARVTHETSITEVIFADEAEEMGMGMSMAVPEGESRSDIPVAIRVADTPEQDLRGAKVTFESGPASGHSMYSVATFDDLVIVGVGEEHFENVGDISEGDVVVLDNSDYLAFQTYHRHQVHPEYAVWDQFRGGDQPVYPQRPNVLGPRYAKQGAGSVQSGRFSGKMVVVQPLLDEAAYPWQSAWYCDRVADVLGPQLDDQFRLWFVENAMHTGAEPVSDIPLPDTTPSRKTRVVSYLGVVQQALRDVVAWVEEGVVPPASTEYERDNGQVSVPHTAAERRGVQPVVSLSANGRERAEVGIGDTVEFSGSIRLPSSTGAIVDAEWDFEGTGEFPVAEDDIHGAFDRLDVTTTYEFDEPGTYFPALRATSQRGGDVSTDHARIQNLGRVRVVVE